MKLDPQVRALLTAWEYADFFRAISSIPVYDSHDKNFGVTGAILPLVGDELYFKNMPFIGINDGPAVRPSVNEEYEAGNYGYLPAIIYGTDGDFSPEYTGDNGNTDLIRAEGAAGYFGIVAIFNKGDVSPKGHSAGTFVGIVAVGNEGDVSPESENNNAGFGGIYAIGSKGDVSPKAPSNATFGNQVAILTGGDLSPEGNYNSSFGSIVGVFNDGDVSPKARFENSPLGVIAGIGNNGDVNPQANKSNSFYGGVFGVANEGDVNPQAGQSNGVVLGVTGVMNNGDVNPSAGGNNGGALGLVSGTTGVLNNGSVTPSSGENSGHTIGIGNNGDVVSNSGTNQSAGSRNGYTPLTVGLLNDGQTRDDSFTQNSLLGSTVVGFDREGYLVYNVTRVGIQGEYDSDLNSHFAFDLLMSGIYGDSYQANGSALSAPNPDDPRTLELVPEFADIDVPTVAQLVSDLGENVLSSSQSVITEETEGFRPTLEGAEAEFEENVSGPLQESQLNETPTFDAEREQLDAQIAEFEQQAELDAVELPSVEEPTDMLNEALATVSPDLGEPTPSVPTPRVNEYQDARVIAEDVVGLQFFALDVTQFALDRFNESLPSAEDLSALLQNVFITPEMLQGLVEDAGLGAPGGGEIPNPVDMTGLQEAVTLLVEGQTAVINRIPPIVESQAEFLIFYGESTATVVGEYLMSYAELYQDSVDQNLIEGTLSPLVGEEQISQLDLEALGLNGDLPMNELPMNDLPMNDLPMSDLESSITDLASMLQMQDMMA